jgi:4-amino-4-deoxy-L-arabinose transferase-like glycosyltransferase
MEPAAQPRILKRALMLVGGVALVIQLILAIALSPAAQKNSSADYVLFYEPAARGLLSGQGPITAQGEFCVLYPIGFPLYLAAAFGVSGATGIPEYLVLRLFTILCGVITPLLVAAIASQWFPLRSATIAGLLCALYPFQIYLSKQPNPESPFEILLLLSLGAFLRLLRSDRINGASLAWLGLAAGIALGAATLIRPITLLLPVPLAALALWSHRRRRLLHVTLFVAGFILILTPWEVAAHARTGRWIPVSTNGPYSTFDGLTFALSPHEAGHPLDIDPNIKALMQSALDHRAMAHSTAEQLAFLGAYAAREPWTVLKLILFKARRAWYATNAQWYETQSAIVQIPYLLLLLAGMVVGMRQPAQRPFALIAITVIVFFWAMTVAGLPILRYLVPAITFAMPLAAVPIDKLIAHGRPSA